MRRKFSIVLAVCLLLGVATVLAAVPPARGATVTYTLYGSNTNSKGIGWGFTSGTITNPGPALSAKVLDTVTFSLFSADTLPHQWFLDSNNNGVPDPGEPISGQFTSSTLPTSFSFTPTTPGTFTYRCAIHPTTMYGTFTLGTLTLANFPQPFLNSGVLTGNLALGLSAPKVYNGVQIAAAASTIDVVGGIPLAGSLGSKSTSGMLGAYLDTEAVSADGSTVVIPGNFMGIGGRGNNLYTKAINPSLPVRQALPSDGTGVGIYCGGTNYRNGANATGGQDQYGFIAMNYNTTGARYDFVGAGLSGFATRTVSQLLALDVAGVLPPAGTAGTLFTGTGIVIKLHDGNNDNIFETYQVVCGTGGAVLMSLPASIPATPTIARLFGLGLSQPKVFNGTTIASAASTIDVVGGVPLAARQGRDLKASGSIWGALDTELVSADGNTVLDTTHNLVSLGGRGNNLLSRYYNPSLVVRQALATDGTGRGLYNSVNGNNWVNQLTTLPYQQYAMDSTLVDAANGNRLVELVAGLSGFGTRAGAQGLASGSVVRGTQKGIIIQFTDTNGDNVFESSTIVDQSSAVAYTYYDFFNVPYGEWWDYRTAVYGDLPVGAECFNATAIANAVCTPKNPSVPDFETYPYTDWYPSPGDFNPKNTTTDAWVYAPYRMHAVGNEVPGYNLSEPVFLPIRAYNVAPGNRLDFNWKFGYVDTATFNYLNSIGCPIPTNDGFIGRSQVSLTMDLQESKRMFGVVATDAASAQTWWNSNTNPDCFLKGTAETNLENWFKLMGGTATTVGKYDIANAFEWYYQPYYTQMSATVDADGTTHVSIDHVSWGTEVLLGRWFYWGNTSYAKYSLDSTQAKGWEGQELVWFDNMVYKGSLTSTYLNFDLVSAQQYHFAIWSHPGPDGLLNQVGDIPYWFWGPVLSDYTNDWSSVHLISELDRYIPPTQATVLTYLHSVPGTTQYNKQRAYEYVPTAWNLKVGHKWTFLMPTGNVPFYDPNLTPVGTDPTSGGYVVNMIPLKLEAMTNYVSAGLFTYDSVNKIVTVRGPVLTGGPVGSPGGGYPLYPYPTISFIS